MATPATLRIKFKCAETGFNRFGTEHAELDAVYNDATIAEEQQIGAVPNASLTVFIDNPEAQGFFIPGQDYYLDCSRVPVSDPV